MEDTDLHMILSQLERIAVALEALAQPDQNYTPDYVRPIEEYQGFDWDSIHATVVKNDKDGPTHVQWNGHVYTRRSPVNKFKPAIWYSRAVGKTEEGNQQYSSLITFREIADSDPLPDKAREMTTRKPGFIASPVQPPKPNGTPALSPAHADLVSYTQYIQTAKEKGISQEGANWIAQMFGVNPEDDHSEPTRCLEYFRDAKSAGWKLGKAWETLYANGKDPKKAMTKLPTFA